MIPCRWTKNRKGAGTSSGESGARNLEADTQVRNLTRLICILWKRRREITESGDKEREIDELVNIFPPQSNSRRENRESRPCKREQRKPSLQERTEKAVLATTTRKSQTILATTTYKNQRLSSGFAMSSLNGLKRKRKTAHDMPANKVTHNNNV